MVNRAKANDPRFWKIWHDSGAVGNVLTDTEIPGLKDLVDRTLNGRDTAFLPLEDMYAATGDHATYTIIARGMFCPTVGVYGDWSDVDKAEVRNIVEASQRGASLGHEFGRAMTGRDDPFVAPRRSAYTQLERMRPGQIARVSTEIDTYLLAAFPCNGPSTATVLFLR